MDDVRDTRSSTKRTADSEVIDVDTMPSLDTVPSSSHKGKGAAKVARFDQPIDVDDPASWVMHASSSAGGPSGAGRAQPSLKFDGPVGVALYEQKMEVLGEEEFANVGHVVPSLGAVTTADNQPVAATASAAPAAVETRACVSKASVLAPLAVAVAPDVPSVSAPAVAPAVAAVSTDGATRGVSVGGFRSQSRSSLVRASLLRRAHKKHKFVRRAAVMSVARAPRMVAGPPSPAHAGFDLDAGASVDNGVSGGEMDGDVPVDTDFDPDSDAEPKDDAAVDIVGTAKDASVGTATAAVMDEASATQSASVASGVVPAIVAAVATPPPGVSSAPANTSTEPLPAAKAANDAETLAEQLAARSRNPRIFPVTSFWLPGAQAVLSAAHAHQAAALPPVPPPSARRSLPLSVPVFPVPQATAPSQPTVHGSQSRPAESVDDSSEDMDDDELVAAYITPPASPLLALPAASPRRPRPSPGQRRRANEARAVRAATAAASSAGVEHELPPALLRDLQDALRNGFSSVRRELTRLRVELVVVKSQSASTLRRIDGIAAAADGRESGSGVVLERLAVVDSAVRDLSERLSATRTGATGADEESATANSVALVAEIKVSSCPPFLSSLSP